MGMVIRANSIMQAMYKTHSSIDEWHLFILNLQNYILNLANLHVAILYMLRTMHIKCISS